VACRIQWDGASHPDEKKLDDAVPDRRVFCMKDSRDRRSQHTRENSSSLLQTPVLKATRIFNPIKVETMARIADAGLRRASIRIGSVFLRRCKHFEDKKRSRWMR